jgi:hypothetical protein
MRPLAATDPVTFPTGQPGRLMNLPHVQKEKIELDTPCDQFQEYGEIASPKSVPT